MKNREPVPTARGLELLVEALRVLPGVGPRSAQRMAYHLLQHDRAGGEQLAHALTAALANVRRCAKCNNFAEEELCALCRSPRRDAALNHLGASRRTSSGSRRSFTVVSARFRRSPSRKQA